MTDCEKTQFNQLVAKVNSLCAENNELKCKLKELEKEKNEMKEIVTDLDKGQVYKNAAIRWAYIDKNLPSWAADTAKKLCDRGILKGNEKNSYELSYDLLRTLVLLDRAGCFDK